MKAIERRRGAVLALLACGVALGASVLLAPRPKDGPEARASGRDEARLCRLEDDSPPPLI